MAQKSPESIAAVQKKFEEIIRSWEKERFWEESKDEASHGALQLFLHAHGRSLSDLTARPLLPAKTVPAAVEALLWWAEQVFFATAAIQGHITEDPRALGKRLEGVIRGSGMKQLFDNPRISTVDAAEAIESIAFSLLYEAEKQRPGSEPIPRRGERLTESELERRINVLIEASRIVSDSETRRIIDEESILVPLLAGNMALGAAYGLLKARHMVAKSRVSDRRGRGRPRTALGILVGRVNEILTDIPERNQIIASLATDAFGKFVSAEQVSDMVRKSQTRSARRSQQRTNPST